MLPDVLTFIDIETTGLSAIRDRIIELGIIRVENGKVVDAFETLLNPEMMLPPEITLLTGIAMRELENAPSFYSVRNRIKELMQDSIFVAHNARFDYSFIRQEFKRLDESFRMKTLCTAKLSRILYPHERGHSLDALIDRFGIECTMRHRAMGDAQVLWEFVQKINLSEAVLESAVQEVLKTQTLPPGIELSYVQNLPETSGVYIFYNSEGLPLYIGKSTNLKDRVLTHFQQSLSDQKEARIFQRIASLECIQTEGELGALLLESKLIKEHKPLYNRTLRKAETLIGLVEHQTSDGYFSVKIKELSEIPNEDISNVVAIFKTQKKLKNALNEIAHRYTLCKKLFGIEKTKGACFGSQLETCNGACIGKEKPAVYNLRFMDAFRRTKIQQWPYTEPIVLVEGKIGTVVSHWCITGSVDLSDSNISLDSNVTFDYDAYKIISSYLLRKQKAIKIHPLSSIRSNEQSQYLY